MPVDERESILGQVYFALGAGAGPMRIERKVIGQVREQLWDKMSEWPALWKEQGNEVLERARAMGRLAALTATQRGSITIEEDDLRDAAGKVSRISFTEVCGRLLEEGFLRPKR